MVQLVNQLNAGKEPLVKKIAFEAINWSIKAGQTSQSTAVSTNNVNTLGDPELHHVFGTKFAKETADTYEAEKHLLLGTKESPAVLAHMLFKWATGPGTVTDSKPPTPAQETPEILATGLPLYLSRGVLGYLSVGNIRDARAVLREFLKIVIAESSSSSSSSSKLGLSPYLVYEENSPSTSLDTDDDDSDTVYVFKSLPLLNFIQLLVPTCQTRSAEMYNRLRTRYIDLIESIDAWKSILEKIAQLYFGIAPPRPQGNMLQDLFGSLMGGPGGLGALGQ